MKYKKNDKVRINKNSPFAYQADGSYYGIIVQVSEDSTLPYTVYWKDLNNRHLYKNSYVEKDLFSFIPMEINPGDFLVCSEEILKILSLSEESIQVKKNNGEVFYFSKKDLNKKYFKIEI